MDAVSTVYGVVAVLAIHFLSEASGVCILPEPAHNDSACSGTHENVFTPSCAGESVIAVGAVSAGAKPVTLNCPAENTAGMNTSAICCVEGAGDCTFDIGRTVYHSECSGSKTCKSSGVQRHQVRPDICGGDLATKYPAVTNYLAMYYYCVEGSRIMSMCTPRELSSIGPALYLQSPGYPKVIAAGQTGCTCSVETSDCDVNINMFHIHRNFTSSNDTCQQSLNIQGGVVSLDLTCDQPEEEYVIGKEMLVSTYLVITMDNTMETADGRFWLGFQDTIAAANLSLNCPAAAQQHCFKTCPTLDVPHLTVTEATTYGSNVTVTCDTGYNINGSDNLVCQDDGTWNNAIPSCDAIGSSDTNSDIIIIVICVAVAFVLISAIILIVVYVVCCRNKPQNETEASEESSEIVSNQPEHEVEYEGSRAEHIKLRPDFARLHLDSSTIAPVTSHLGNTILAQNDTNSVQKKQATVNPTGGDEHIPAQPKNDSGRTEAEIVFERKKLVQEDGTSVEPSITIIDEGRHARKKKKKKHKKHHRSDLDVTADTGETDEHHIDDKFHTKVTSIDEVVDRSGEERHRRKKKRKHRTKDIQEPSLQLE